MPTTIAFDQLLGISIAAVAGIFATRCVVGTVLYALGLLPGAAGERFRRWAARLTPSLARRALAMALGATALVGTTGVGVAQAAPSAAAGLPNLDRGPVAADVGPSNGRQGLPDPDRVATAGQSDTAEPGKTVVVSDEDCLWSIAKSRLGRHATDQQVDREWRRWYQRNRAVIGNNPDLVPTGARLVAPTRGAS